MPFKIIRDDITRVAADAIVNTANPGPIYAAGTDYAIYIAAGAEELLAERKKIGKIAPGEAAVTPAFKLNAKYIIHTVGPSWVDGDHGEFDTLASCYRKSLLLARQLRCESIAFPLISTGIYGFPKDEALTIALDCIRDFLDENEMDVTLVVFDKTSFALSSSLTESIEQFIDEKYVTAYKGYAYPDRRERESQMRTEEMRRRSENAPRLKKSPRGPKKRDSQKVEKEPKIPGFFTEKPKYSTFWDAEESVEELSFDAVSEELADEDLSFGASYASSAPAPSAPAPSGSVPFAPAPSAPVGFASAPSAPAPSPLSHDVKGRSLQDLMNNVGETFQQCLLRMIDERGLTDTEVYKKANIDRKLFSKIRCNAYYTPTKRTALSLAIALGLNLDETIDLLGRAGLALSPSNKTDLIVEYCIVNKIYDMFQINSILFNYDQQTLG